MSPADPDPVRNMFAYVGIFQTKLKLEYATPRTLSFDHHIAFVIHTSRLTSDIVKLALQVLGEELLGEELLRQELPH